MGVMKAKAGRTLGGRIIRRATLPGIWPRLRDLFGSGFAHVCYFMAVVYRSVNLLPAAHPYLDHNNVGKYGLWNVMGEARRNLIFDRHHIDQIIVFGALCGGVVLLFMQILMVVLALAVSAAWAGPISWWIFTTGASEDDLAFVTLDRVFGIPDIFGSRIAGGDDGPFPNAFHQGLHTLFEFYSMGVFAVAMIVIIYYVITIVGETAQSGTPFGQRFNGVWAPVRLMLCIGLLAPLEYGMNFAQLSTLRVAGMGSSMATNAWLFFITEVGTDETILGPDDSLVAIPNRAPQNNLLEWILVARTCSEMYYLMYDRDVFPYIVNTKPVGHSTGAAQVADLGVGYAEAAAMADQGTITIVMGEENAALYSNYPGNIKPLCGKLGMQVVDAEQPGAIMIQEAYYTYVQNQLNVADSILGGFGEAIALRFVPTADKDPTSAVPSAAFLRTMRAGFNNMAQTAIDEGRDAQLGAAEWDDFAAEYGWAGAGIWYNKIAQYNGTLFGAVYNLPTPLSYPEVMETASSRRGEEESELDPSRRYSPSSAGGDYAAPAHAIEYPSEGDRYIAQATYFAQQIFQDSYIQEESNALMDIINMIFGTTGLFDMRENIDAGIHPLAALTAVGNSLINSTIMSLGGLGMGTAMGAAGLFTGSGALLHIGKAIGSIAVQVGMLGLSLGFILYYVLPMLPFIYFFFSFGGWVKAIFQAMVGLPLWAVAHLRIDGDGVPGQMAMDGYYMIFEIFARPIMLLVSLIASVTIFSAMVRVLNGIWDLVLTNLVGNRPDGTEAVTPSITVGLLDSMGNTVDFLFYTAIYAIFVYMLAMSSFKLIDEIPNYFMRWMGKQISGFGEGERSDASGQGLVQNVYMGSEALKAQFGQGAGVLGSLFQRHT